MPPRWGLNYFCCIQCYKHVAPMGLEWFSSLYKHRNGVYEKGVYAIHPYIFYSMLYALCSMLFPVALLVFLPASARTRIITSNFRLFALNRFYNCLWTTTGCCCSTFSCSFFNTIGTYFT